MKIVTIKEQPSQSKIGDLFTKGPCIGVKTPMQKLARCFISFSALAVSLSIISSTAIAQAEQDPLLAKPNLMWLSDDLNVPVFGDGEYDSFLGKSEIWTNNWGVSAKLLQNDSDDVFGLPKDSKYFNFDVKHRVFGSQDKSNLESNS